MTNVLFIDDYDLLKNLNKWFILATKKIYDKILTCSCSQTKKRQENKELHSNVVKFVTISSGFIPLLKEVEDQQFYSGFGAPYRDWYNSF